MKRSLDFAQVIFALLTNLLLRTEGDVNMVMDAREKSTCLLSILAVLPHQQTNAISLFALSLRALHPRQTIGKHISLDALRAN